MVDEPGTNRAGKVTSGDWIWLGVFVGLVFGFAILEIVDVLDLLRQVCLTPVFYVVYCVNHFLMRFDINATTAFELLDVDRGGGTESLVRVIVFTAEMFLIMLPVYRYWKTRNRVYLCWLAGIGIFVIAGLCWFLVLFLSMIGMMD